MVQKLKAFAVWFAVPYLAVFIVVPGLLSMLGRDSFFRSRLYWSGQPLMLMLCAIPAFCGTVVLWLLPIRRALLGVLTGAVLAIVGVVLRAWFQLAYWGGFEANVDILMGALMLIVPSGFGGAYAGLLRSRQSAATVSGSFVRST